MRPDAPGAQDPTRLAVVGATDLERRLLDAAANEGPSAELTRRMRLGLGFSATAAAAVATATTKTATSKVAAAKVMSTWASGGALALAITGGVVAVWISARSPVPARTVAAIGSRPEAVSMRDPAPPTAQPVVSVPAHLSALPASAPFAVSPSRHHLRAAASGRDLRGEIALIDAARSALRTGAPERALALVHRYGTTYPAGTFGPEAAALRIEALAGSGQTDQARTRARDFLAEHPDSPLSERIARIADAPPR